MMLVAPMPDGLQWAFQAPLVYQSDLAGQIIVPKNFCTDFASIPRVLWVQFPPWSRYGPAACLHDWVYWSKPCSRDTADCLLSEAMTLLGVEKSTVEQIYTAVHLFGQGAWDHNSELKAAGYSRMAGIKPVPPYACLPDLLGAKK
jgi:hypothetical protein